MIDRLVAAIPPHWLRLHTAVTAIESHSRLTPHSSLADKANAPPWTVLTSTTGKHCASETFDAVFLATPLVATRQLLTPIDADAAHLLPHESSSAVLVAFAYADATRVPLPPGFGFLVPPSLANNEASVISLKAPNSEASSAISTEGGAPRYPRPSGLGLSADHIEGGFSPWGMPTAPSLLLACTFVDQKFPHRVPPNGRLVRAFFGGVAADRIARCNNDEIAAIARLELARILNANAPISGPAPTPAPPPALTVVRRWPNSLPQYAVGHLDRVAELESRIRAQPGLTLLGNALHGVGIPDLIRAARQAAHRQLTTNNS
jgi:oxygen-dependent protoporphyrinogen oxidase